MDKVLLLVLLGLTSFTDIKRREISVIHIIVFGIIGLLFFFLNKDMTFLNLFGGIGLGILVLLLSMMTKGEIGIGDGLIMIITGIYTGGYKNLEIFLFSLIMSSLFSLGLYVYCKNIKKEIPFVPFVLLAYIILEITG